MSAISRFSFPAHSGPYEKWPLKSQLFCDGQPTGTELAGYALLHQFETPTGYFLVHDWDCPFEEMTHFTLLDRKFHILSSRALGAPYQSWLLTGIEASGDNCFEATFGDRDNWRITLRPWGLRYLYPRIALQRLDTAGAGGTIPR
jgi:hypothetical protein